MKSKIISATILGGALILGLTTLVGAQITPASSTPSTANPPMILEVGPGGRVTMRGTIGSVESGKLTVKSWGGDWTVLVSVSTEVLPPAAGKDLTTFKVGDFVGVQGKVNPTRAWTIDAKIVRDWTYRKEVREERKQNLQEVRQVIKNETPRNYQGTLSNLSGSTFTFTVGGTAYTVNIASGAKILNRTFLTASLSDFKKGDTIRVWGTRTDTAISAEVVRDVSLPR